MPRGIPRESNFMRIRIVDPDIPKWAYIRKFAGDYYIASKYEQGATQFVTLDVGKKGGLAFIRGVLPDKKAGPGDPVENRWWTTQSIRVEYSKIGLTTETKPAKAISTLKKSELWEFIRKHVRRQLKKEVAEIKIISKGNDDFLLLALPKEK